MVKNLPAMQETQFQPLGWEDPLEEGMATHSKDLKKHTYARGYEINLAKNSRAGYIMFWVSGSRLVQIVPLPEKNKADSILDLFL